MLKGRVDVCASVSKTEVYMHSVEKVLIKLTNKACGQNLLITLVFYEIELL